MLAYCTQRIKYLRPRFRRSRTKGVNAHARTQATVRLLRELLRRARTIVLIVVNNSFDFIWPADALYLELDSHGDAFKRISRERPLPLVTPRAHQKRKSLSLSLSLQPLTFLILYCINKARAAESERSFTGETGEVGRKNGGKRSFAD